MNAGVKRKRLSAVLTAGWGLMEETILSMLFIASQKFTFIIWAEWGGIRVVLSFC